LSDRGGVELGAVHPTGQNAERGQLLERLRLGELALGVTDRVAERRIQTLREGGGSTVQALEGLAAVVRGQAKARLSGLRRVKSECLLKEVSPGPSRRA
jgi:hypothetical protein